MPFTRASLLILLALAAAGFLSGCASPDESQVSTIPWNRPQSWEGGGALGGFNTDYMNQ